MQLQEIEAVLLCDTLEAYWDECIKDWEAASRQEKLMAHMWIGERRDTFLQMARDVDDPETLDMMIAIQFIACKSEWILFNTQIQYQTVFKGGAENLLILRATLISHFLGLLEPLLKPTDVNSITDFLATPIQGENAEWAQAA